MLEENLFQVFIFTDNILKYSNVRSSFAACEGTLKLMLHCLAFNEHVTCYALRVSYLRNTDCETVIHI